MRPLRPPIRDGIFHVTANGIECRRLFVDTSDRLLFLRYVDKVVSRLRWSCAAYCLMGTHYHLIVQTPNGDLSVGMQLLNGWYGQAYSKRYGRRGHLFATRFGSVLVENDSHLLEVIRYVVLNPVRAGICRTAGEWPWSSYGATVGAVKAPAFSIRIGR